jgi:hypothetical protein
MIPRPSPILPIRFLQGLPFPNDNGYPPILCVWPENSKACFPEKMHCVSLDNAQAKRIDSDRVES